MSRKCSVCNHPQHEAIDQALISNEPYRNIAKQFSINASSVLRHKNSGHISAALVKAQAVAEVLSADNLLQQLKDLHTTVMDTLKQAQAANDRRVIAALVGQARGNIELTARLLGLLSANGVVVNQYQAQVILQSKDFEEFRKWKLKNEEFENMSDAHFSDFYKHLVQASGSFPPFPTPEAATAPDALRTPEGASTEEAGAG